MIATARVQTGLEVLVADGFAPLVGRRVGAIANPTSVDSRMRHLADLLHDAPGVTLAALFGPEHGARSDAQDMIGVGHAPADRRTGVPVHSLYGEGEASLRPTPGQLDGLDALVFDVQDVGSRYYTFAATMLYAMEAAADLGLRFVVLDRPNPLGGSIVSGPTVAPGFSSFVGAYPLPIRHGLTVGELACLFQIEQNLALDLIVVPCQGWRRSMLWPETDLPWILPSPNMPTLDTTLVYPGGCLIEGTNLSEGRGTTRPFELWGAPWIDADAIANVLADEPGVLLRPCAFRPTFHKHAGSTCHGVQPIVTDPTTFEPIGLYAAFLALSRSQRPDRFAWRTEPYEFVREPIAIDLLFGSAVGRSTIEAFDGSEIGDWQSSLRSSWAGDEAAFRERRQPVLLYGD